MNRRKIPMGKPPDPRSYVFTQQELGTNSAGPDLDKMRGGGDEIAEDDIVTPVPTLGPVDSYGNIPDDLDERFAIAESAPVIQIVKGTGLDADKGGEFVRVKVETLTQGEIVLHLELAMVTELIHMLTAGRHYAEKFAAERGAVPPRTVTNVLSFAVGDIPQAPSGTMLVINHGDPSEQMFLVPNPQAAREIAKSLAQGAEDATRRTKGILPAHGMNGHGRLLGPGGRPLA
jgi:hypothetical protein